MRAGGPDDGRQDTLGLRDVRQRRGTLQRAWGYHLCDRTRTCFLRARLQSRASANRKRLVGTATWGGEETTLAAFAEALEGNPRVRSESIRRFVEGWPHGQNAPEAIVAKGGGGGSGEGCPQHGICLRLRIPYTTARVTSLQLNGEDVLGHGPGSATDGWTSWTARGYHFVQLNIPPAKSRGCDLYLITCEYEPGQKRRNWRGWRRD